MSRLPQNATHSGDRRAVRLNPRDQTLDRLASRRIRADRLFSASGLLAAVSGGPDSVALLHFLASERERAGRPVRLAVGHVNHGLRGRDSDDDARFVREFAEQLGVPYFEERIPQGAFRTAGAKKDSPDALAPEDLARRLRYEALGRLADAASATVIATAHTSDDQAETVLFRMARGAGLKGLAGMASRALVHGVRVIRPLLDATRDHVLTYLALHGVAFREDASNENRAAARNYLRHEVLPRLRDRVNPRVREALVRQADLFRELDGYLEVEARHVLPSILDSAEEGKIVLDADRLVSYPKLLRTYIFRCVFQDLDAVSREVSAVHVDVLHSLASNRGGRSADLPLGMRAKREGKRLILTGRKQEPATDNLHPTLETSGIPADSRKGIPSA